MTRINENEYLNLRALAYAIDKCLQEVNDSKCIELENALMLSALLVQEFGKVDEKR